MIHDQYLNDIQSNKCNTDDSNTWGWTREGKKRPSEHEQRAVRDIDVIKIPPRISSRELWRARRRLVCPKDCPASTHAWGRPHVLRADVRGTLHTPRDALRSAEDEWRRPLTQHHPRSQAHTHVHTIGSPLADYLCEWQHTFVHIFVNVDEKCHWIR